MDTTSINFLKQRQKALTAAVVTDRRYVVWMSYLLIGVIILGVIVFGFDFFLQRSIGRVNAQQDEIDIELRQQSQIEETYLQLAEKVGVIDKILTGRIEKRQTLQYFTSLFLTDDIALKEIGFQSSEVLEFVIVSSDVFTLEQILDQLESEEVQSRFASLSTTDLARNTQGQYSMRVSVGLKKNTQPSPRPTLAPIE